MPGFQQLGNQIRADETACAGCKDARVFRLSELGDLFSRDGV
jgi:hypothetical protein